MKHRFFIVALIVLFFCGCSDNDDTVVNNSIDELGNLENGLVFLPRYEDGKASIEYRAEDGEFYITANFKTLSARLAERIADEWNQATGDKNVTADYTEVQTRTTSVSSLEVTKVVSSNETEGLITIEMKLPLEALLKPFFFSVSAKAGNTLLMSAYVPVYKDDLDKQLAYVPDPRPIPAIKDGLYYTWGDEFNIDGSVNEELWTFEEGFKRGNEPQNYVKGIDNAIVVDGRLLITAKKERRKNPNYDPTSGDYRMNWEYGEYTSASMNGNQKRFFLFGRTEVRAKIDPSSGSFPAIWTCGNNKEWPLNGEIDIMEFYIHNGEQSLTSNFAAGKKQPWEAIWNSRWTPLSYYELKDPDWIKKYHVYRMDWDEKEIKLYVDDELRNSIKVEEFLNEDGSIVFHNPQYMWLNLALKDQGRGIDLSETKNIQFEVDYFRLYQKVIDHQKPSKVTNFTAKSKDGLVNLSWKPSIDTGGAGLLRYDLYRGGIGSGYFIGSTTTTSFTEVEVAPGAEMTYYIQALDGVGNYSDVNEVTVRPEGGGGLHEGNLVPDGTMESLPIELDQSLPGFDGSWGNASWGSLRVLTGGYWGKYIQITGGNGELQFPVTWTPNTTYVLRAKIKTTGSGFEFGLGKVKVGDSSLALSIPNTRGEWIQFEQEFMAETASTGNCSLHNWSSNTVVQMDNWELYEKE